jgi:hypothetical protein
MADLSFTGLMLIHLSQNDNKKDANEQRRQAGDPIHFPSRGSFS